MMEVLNLFPTPILISNILRDFTSNELDFISKQMHEVGDTRINGNFTTKNHKILNCHELENIKKIIENHIDYYVTNIECIQPELKVYITQSFINYINPGCGHHAHNHFNSYIAGVLYINADKEKDKICFHKSPNKGSLIFTPEREIYNQYNSETFYVPVGTGDLILFPADQTHSVDKNESEYIRISLAFNTFIRGKLGSYEKYSDVEL